METLTPATTLFPEEGKIIHVIERTDEPAGVWASLKNAAKESFKGAVISGGISALVGAALGALGSFGNAQNYTEQLQQGGIKLGGHSVFGLTNGPQIILTGLETSLELQPVLTSAALGAADTALKVGINASVIGAGVGAVKGGWVDYITNERELARHVEKQVPNKS